MYQPLGITQYEIKTISPAQLLIQNPTNTRHQSSNCRSRTQGYRRSFRVGGLKKKRQTAKKKRGSRTRRPHVLPSFRSYCNAHHAQPNGAVRDKCLPSHPIPMRHLLPQSLLPPAWLHWAQRGSVYEQHHNAIAGQSPPVGE